MNIIIENTSAQPLYEQIVRQIQDAILTGELAPGAPLPSIRHLARELKVSIITAKRAYEELEAAGFVQSTPGRGTYVSMANVERLREAAISQIEQKLSEAVDAAKTIPLTLAQLQEIITELYEEENE